jgi:alcohol dehydrogenase YqhD (iron-dependent ADH family)
MNNFEFYAPTKIIFGKDTESQVGEQILAFNGKKVLIHYGSESVKKSGLLRKVQTSLEELSIPYVELGGVVPNPRLSKVNEGIDLCKKENVDFILAVGGGSVIDSAKAIGYGVYNGGNLWDFFQGKRTIAGCLPIGCVLTISAAGSEMSNSCVITNEDGWYKRGSKSDFGRPKFSILNPELTYTLPEYQIASGIVDILMHTIERYFSNVTMELTDNLSEALLRNVIKNGYLLFKDEPPTTSKLRESGYEPTAQIMWAGALSHNGLFACGTDGGDWAPHQLEHELGGMFDVAHGAGISAVWGSWARYVYQDNISRFARFATHVMTVSPDNKDQETLALEGIAALEDFFRAIKMPVTISELGIKVTQEQILELAEKCSFHNTRTIGRIKTLNTEDMVAILEMSK